MTLDTATKQWLRKTFGRGVAFDEPMSRHTWFRVGGPADAIVRPRTAEALVVLIERLQTSGVPHMVIGGGTNLLVRDGGIRGVVVSTAGCLTGIAHEEKGGGSVSLTAGAGARLRSLCSYAADRGFEGMSFAVGIPGTVGGGVEMNAGTRYGCIGDVLDAVTVLGPDLKRTRVPRERLRFSYRKLEWDPDIERRPGARPLILEGVFGLHAGDSRKIRRETQRILKERKLSQPVGEAGAGCFFKNPPTGKTAGQLIDMAGLKGKRVGGAAVSKAHANFIVNKGEATAEDVLKLKDLIQETVRNLFQIDLETEVKIVGTSEQKNG